MAELVEKTEWLRVCLCEQCGIILSLDDIYDRDNTCGNCGKVSSFHTAYIATSRRFCYTYKPSWFERYILRKEPKGYWEWSKEQEEIISKGGHLVSGKIFRGKTNMAVTAFASGLF